MTPDKYRRTFSISRLYFRYVFGTPWEFEFTGESMAVFLHERGLIDLLEGGTRYAENQTFRKFSHRSVFIKSFEKIKGFAIVNSPKPKGGFMKRLCLGFICLASLVGCASEPKYQGFDLPPALREVYRGGQLAPMQNATDGNLGIRGRPTKYDSVQHVCVSKPIYNIDGSYARTDTLCF